MSHPFTAQPGKARVPSRSFDKASVAASAVAVSGALVMLRRHVASSATIQVCRVSTVRSTRAVSLARSLVAGDCKVAVGSGCARFVQTHFCDIPQITCQPCSRKVRHAVNEYLVEITAFRMRFKPSQRKLTNALSHHFSSAPYFLM